MLAAASRLIFGRSEQCSVQSQEHGPEHGPETHGGTYRSPVATIAVMAAMLAVCTFGTAATVDAADLPQPTGEILLKISGNISNTNSEDGAVFDLEMLETMESYSFETVTPWTKGVTKFTGVALSLILETVGAKSRKLRMTAEDGYIYETVKTIDDKYPVIIAYKKNDEYMSLRQLGPLWMMFPFDDFPELDTEENRAASVWQLRYLEVM